jgi:hypothetical protein
VLLLLLLLVVVVVVLVVVVMQNCPCIRLQTIPTQDNHCDCGLFVLTYLELFVFALPAAVSPEVVNKKDGEYNGRCLRTRVEGMDLLQIDLSYWQMRLWLWLLLLWWQLRL